LANRVKKPDIIKFYDLAYNLKYAFDAVSHVLGTEATSDLIEFLNYREVLNYRKTLLELINKYINEPDKKCFSVYLFSDFRFT